MSLLGKLFGTKSPEQERAHADALFAQGDYGAAKLAYDRAAGHAKGNAELQAELGKRSEACRDALARKHLAEAEHLIAQGVVELGQEELRQVLQIAADPALLQQARERAEKLERAVVRAEVAQQIAPNEEDRFELIAGSFEDDQYAEYQAHGEPMRDALLLLHDGQTAEARALLEDLIGHADGPRYLWFELGRARLAEGDSAGGQQALEKFLASLHLEEGGDARLLAQIELAQLAHARGEFDAAVAHYESALAALPEDPRPYLALASFFRREKLLDEAVEVLEAGLEALEGQKPDVRLWQELGLTLADAGKDAPAIEWLERMVELLVAQQHTDLPPEGGVRLAQLHERAGNLPRALDLYSLLAHGSDRANLHAYHEQAARLLRALDMQDEARRMLVRARELVPEGDAESGARIEAALQALTAAPA